MTDKHPLTDKIIDTFASPQYDYFEGIGEINLGNDHDDLRAAADWQLEQVIAWLEDNLDERYVWADVMPPGIDVEDLIIDIKLAMRPATTQEDNND